MAMFVEDFIIDAYDIQLREEVGNIGVVHMSRFYLCCRLFLRFGAISLLQNRRRSRQTWMGSISSARLWLTCTLPPCRSTLAWRSSRGSGKELAPQESSTASLKSQACSNFTWRPLFMRSCHLAGNIWSPLFMEGHLRCFTTEWRQEER